MAGAKAAKRLSQTQPKMNGANQETKKMAEESADKVTGKRAPTEVGNAPPEAAHGEREQVSSRSASPSAPFSAASEQSKSPTSPASPTFTSLPKYPPSSPEKATRAKENPRGFFQNRKASRSATKLHHVDQPTVRTVQQDVPPSEETPKGPQRTNSTPDMRESRKDPVPNLPPRLEQHDGSQTSLNSGHSGHAIPRRPVGSNNGSRSNTMQSIHDAMPQSATQSPPQVAMGAYETAEAKKNSNRLFTSFMRRNHHSRPEDHSHTQQSQSSNRSRSRPSESSQGKPPSREPSATRGSDAEEPMERPSSKSHMKGDGTGVRLFREFRQQAGHAAKEIQKSRGRFFRHRNSSNTAPPPDFSNYEVKVINQPLVQQTRLTRIAKRLEDSKDKTEFWMPALPWRCIDYLNFNGAEVEGLYRVPGSEREVRLWKARFDQEYDIDLFQEEELYDVNTIGSLFKSWLRDLPEDILPTSTQDELTGRYAGEQKAPEEVKEVLSQLPPWNFYLLFAITCHLSLLHAYQDKNKMTFNNLFVCFAPALRLNGDCFRWLVGDWRACWLGCATEKEALEEEYRILDFGAAEPMAEPNPPFAQDHRPSAGSREGSSAGSSVDATPRAEDFRASPHPPAAQQFAPPTKPPPPSSTGHSSNNSASSKPQGRRPAKPGSSPHSREGSLQAAERKAKESPPPPQPQRPEKLQLKENVQHPASNAAAAAAAAAPAHARGNSQLPELNLPQPISPTFAPNFMSKEGA